MQAPAGSVSSRVHRARDQQVGLAGAAPRSPVAGGPGPGSPLLQRRPLRTRSRGTLGSPPCLRSGELSDRQGKTLVWNVRAPSPAGCLPRRNYFGLSSRVQPPRGARAAACGRGRGIHFRAAGENPEGRTGKSRQRLLLWLLRPVGGGAGRDASPQIGGGPSVCPGGKPGTPGFPRVGLVGIWTESTVGQHCSVH